MPIKKEPPKIYLTPLRGKLKLKDVERAIKRVKAAQEARERASAATSK